MGSRDLSFSLDVTGEAGASTGSHPTPTRRTGHGTKLPVRRAEPADGSSLVLYSTAKPPDEPAPNSLALGADLCGRRNVLVAEVDPNVASCSFNQSTSMRVV